MAKTKSKMNKTDVIGMALLAPARKRAEQMGVSKYAEELCRRIGVPFAPHRLLQVRKWLTTDPENWYHPRAGVAKVMLEI